MEDINLLFPDYVEKCNMLYDVRCCAGEASLKNMPVAMAYVPMQRWRNIYKPQCALEKGTIFAELYLPFMGRGVL